MNKNLIIGLIVFILLVILGYYFLKPDTPLVSDSADKMDSESVMVDDHEETVGTFADLLKLQKSYSCSFDYPDDNGNSTSGTVYISDTGRKMNGQFIYTPVEGDDVMSYLISDGEFNYLWTEGSESGYKMALPDDLDELFAQDSDLSSKGAPFLGDNSAVDFDCQPWKTDSSMFTPPPEVQFIDFSEQFGDVMENKCSACDLLPQGDTKEQCLAALSC